MNRDERTRVLQISAEIFPVLKTGGLADVCGALPDALARSGCDARVLLPGFPAVLAALTRGRELASFSLPWGEQAVLRCGHLAGVACGRGSVTAYVVDAPGLFDRPGNPYLDDQRRPYADNHRRFAALAWGGARLAAGIDPQWAPAVVHAHDWHAALAPALLKLWGPAAQRGVASVYTVHNLAYQGIFDSLHLRELGLPDQAFQMEGVEFHGRISYMKAGLHYADHITTVSPTYAREIQTEEQGCGLDGLLRSRRDHLTGVLNGLDPKVWNPAADAAIASSYDVESMQGKARCKLALQRELGLERAARAPLFVMVSRLAEQKGVNLLLDVVPEILRQGGQLAVLGSGDPELEHGLQREAKAHPGRVAVVLGYDEALAHRMFAGGDVTLVPSRYEPCGLTQMYGLRYASLPLVHAVGGLADTVVDTDLATLEDQTATGWSFREFTAPALRHAVRRAFALHRRPRDWAQVRQTAMGQRFDWEQAGKTYVSLYNRLLAHE